ncbi:hypothetical protein KEA45_05435, partial [Treponema pallidum]
TYMNRSG